MTVRALIAEDEPLARQTLRDFLAEVSWVRCIAEAADGATAVQLIDAETPDLLFLDVRMPELSGLEVLERIRHRPAVVFTTAYDRYAVTAFELEALDYLLKPFSRKRFLATLERVRQRLQQGLASEAAPGADLDRARRALAPATPLHRLFARRGDRIVPLMVDRVSHFEAAGDYVAVHSGGDRFLVHLTLAELEDRLDPQRFRRVHRGHILNLDHVASMRSTGDRRLLITLADGSEVLASRGGSRELRELVV